MAIIQVKSKASTGPVASLTINASDGWATPGAGHLVIAITSVDNLATMSGTPTQRGQSIGDQQLEIDEYNNQPTSVTVTPASSAFCCMTLIEISSGGFDAISAHSENGSQTSSVVTNAVTTTVASDTIFVIASPHGAATASVPTAPTYDNSVTGLVATSPGAGSSTSSVGQFIGSIVEGAIGSFSGTTVSWTNATPKVDSYQIAYKAAAGTGATVMPTAVAGSTTVPIPSLSGNASVHPSVVLGVASVPQPVVKATKVNYNAYGNVDPGLTYAADPTAIVIGLTFYTTKAGQVCNGARIWISSSATGSLGAEQYASVIYEVDPVTGYPTNPLNSGTFDTLNLGAWNEGAFSDVALQPNKLYCAVVQLGANLYSSRNGDYNATSGIDVPAPSHARGLFLAEDSTSHHGFARNGVYKYAALVTPPNGQINGTNFGVDVMLSGPALGNVVQPGVVSGAATVPTVIPNVAGSVHITPGVVLGSAVVPVPIVGQVTVSPAVVLGTTQIPLLIGSMSATVTPSVVTGVATIPAPLITTATGIAQYTGVPDNASTALVSSADHTQISVGTKFKILNGRTDVSTPGMRVYNIGSAWAVGKTVRFELQADMNGDGILDTVLTSKSYTTTGAEPTNGWMQIAWASPVALSASVLAYAVVVYTPTADAWTYPVATHKFDTRLFFNGFPDAALLATGDDGPNGVYSYSSEFPSGVNQASWYGIDPFVSIPSISGALVSPSVVNGATTIPVPGFSDGHATVTPVTVNGRAVIPFINVIVPAQVQIAAVAVTATTIFPNLTGSVSSDPLPTAVSGQAIIPVPTASAASATVVHPTVVLGSASIPTPVTTNSTGVLQVNIVGSTIIPRPQIQVGVRLTQTAVLGATTIPVPIVVAGVSVNVHPTAVAGVTTIPSSIAHANVHAVVVAVAGSTTIPKPTVAGKVQAHPTAVAGTTTIPTPFVGSITNAHVTPAVVMGHAIMAAPVVTFTSQAHATPFAVRGFSVVSLPDILVGAEVAGIAILGRALIPSVTVHTEQNSPEIPPVGGTIKYREGWHIPYGV